MSAEMIVCDGEFFNAVGSGESEEKRNRSELSELKGFL